jgi:hypothetical protein
VNGFFRDKDGKEVFVVGLQCHNSSTGTDMMDKAISAVKQYGGNTLEAPIYWYAIEPEMDRYDMTQIEELIDKARFAGLHLIVLWFGASKNGHPNYAPDYIKLHPETYRIAIGADKAPVASLSPHCQDTLQRDKKAFLNVMAFLKEYDEGERTVLCIQIENEMGYANTDRDYSKIAQLDYEKPLPEALYDVSLEDCGHMICDKTWRGHFGRHAHEAFSAWYHALYMEALAREGKAIYNLPCITNVMVGNSGVEEPGRSYNAGAAVGRMIDIWKICAPSLDLICPDIYNTAKRDYERIARRYDRKDNALFIPESPIEGEANAMNSILAVADYGAIGVCCFGAESALKNDGTLIESARAMQISLCMLSALSPLIIRYRNTGCIHAFVQDEFSQSQALKLRKLHVEAFFLRESQRRFGLGSRINLHTEENQWLLQERGRGLLIQTDEHEFFLAGSGIGLEFTRRPDSLDEAPYVHLCSRQACQLNFLSVEEGHFEGERWVVDYIRNGDESNFLLYAHAGQAVHIRLNPNIGMNL